MAYRLAQGFAKVSDFTNQSIAFVIKTGMGDFVNIAPVEGQEKPADYLADRAVGDAQIAVKLGIGVLS